MKPTTQRTFLFIGLTIPACVWIIYRLYAVEITHDEAWSFHMVYKLLWENLIQTANNHWLNSFFIFLETRLLGTAVWQIRVHSALAFLVFAYFLIKICLRFPNVWIALCTYVFLIYNAYMLDFFSLARGYGLGLAFGMAAIYHILYQPQKRLLIYTFLILSSISVYTQLYLLLAFGLYELVFSYRLAIFTRAAFTNFIKPLWLPILYLFIATKNILHIQRSGDLNEGQTNGFIPDTIGVFLERSFEPFLNIEVASWLGALLMMLLFLAWLLPFRFFRSQECKKLSKLLITAAFIHQLFFFVLHIPFPFGRTALYFCIPLLLCFGLILASLNINKIGQGIIKVVFISLALLQIAYLIGVKNIHTTNEWWTGQGVSAAINKIKSSENRKLETLSLLYYEGHNGVFLNYYNLLNGQDIFQRVNRIHLFHLEEDWQAIKGDPNQFDYILLPDYDSIINSQLNGQLYDTLDYYKDMKTRLLKKRKS